MSKPANRLGKGLSALIPPRDPQHPAQLPKPHTVNPAPHDPNQVRAIPLDQVVPNRHQPRTAFNDATLQELAASIKANGVLQPIVVRADGDGRYELVAGERRWRAARLAALPTIPALVRELSDAQSFEIALIENLQREDLGPLERATAYQHYLDTFGGTIESLATRLSESRANVSNYLRLLKLHPEVCYLIGRGELGMGQARALASLTDSQKQLALARVAIRRNLAVRQVEELVRQATPSDLAEATGEERAPADARGHRQHFRQVEESLSKGVGLHVRLFPGKKKNSGRIVISYNNLDEFDRIAERLGASPQLE